MTGNNTYSTFCSSVVQVGWVNIYIWTHLPVTGQVQFIYITNNDVVIPRLPRCMLIGSRFQPLTELFYIVDTRQSAR